MYAVGTMRSGLQWSLKSATRIQRHRPGSIRGIAARLGISPSSVWRILHGQASRQMAEAYGPLVLALLEGRAGPEEAPAQPQEQAGLWSRLPPSLTVQQAAYILNCNPQTVRDLCRQGILPHTRLRRQFRIDAEALRLFLVQRGVISLDAARHLRLGGRRRREATGEGEKA